MARHNPKPIPELSSEQITFFWSRVARRDPDECWPWTGAKNEAGYGLMYLDTRQPYRVHRIAYFLHHGVDPGEGLVCHTCDFPPCSNAKHFFLGDNRANMQDMASKGRHRLQKRPEDIFGEKHPQAVLKEPDVIEIRRLLHEGMHGRKVAAQFGISAVTISAIKAGRLWPHLPNFDSYPEVRNVGRDRSSYARGESCPHAKLTDDDVKKIKQQLGSGRLQKHIAADFGVSRIAIVDIANKRTWTHVSP